MSVSWVCLVRCETYRSNKKRSLIPCQNSHRYPHTRAKDLFGARPLPCWGCARANVIHAITYLDSELVTFVLCAELVLWYVFIHLWSLNSWNGSEWPTDSVQAPRPASLSILGVLYDGRPPANLCPATLSYALQRSSFLPVRFVDVILSSHVLVQRPRGRSVPFLISFCRANWGLSLTTDARGLNRPPSRPTRGRRRRRQASLRWWGVGRGWTDAPFRGHKI